MYLLKKIVAGQDNDSIMKHRDVKAGNMNEENRFIDAVKMDRDDGKYIFE